MEPHLFSDLFGAWKYLGIKVQPKASNLEKKKQETYKNNIDDVSWDLLACKSQSN